MEIEDSVMIGFGCTILSYSSIDGIKGPVVFKKGCKLCANSVVMPGVIIGENALVGANSLVTENIPAGDVCAGSPARPIKGNI